MLSNEVKDILSVCSVEYSDLFDDLVLVRMADIENGELVRPFIIDDEPKTFGNRIFIYKVDGPIVEDYIGVWRWSATYNKNDYEKDYVTSRFEPSITPIETFVFSSEKSSDDAINELLDGLDIEKPTGNILLARPFDVTNYEVILVNKQSIQEKNGKYTITSNTVKLPFYRISKMDFTTIKGRLFYKKLSLPSTPDGLYSIKEPSDIVKNVIIESISWTTLKSQGYSRDQYKKVKDYVQSIETDSIITKISERLDCSESTARNHFDLFLRRCDEHLSGCSTIDEALLNYLERNEEAQLKCEQSLQSKWEANHKTQIEEAKKELKDITNKSDSIGFQIKVLESKLEQKTEELLLLEEEANKYLTLGDDVKKSIDEKIDVARNNIAEFISQVEFIKSIAQPSGTILIETGSSVACVKDGVEIDSEADVSDSWKDVLSVLEYEMEEAGVRKDCSKDFSTLMYSCYCNNMPVLLAGPNAYDIAIAFSASIEHKTPFTIECRDGVKLANNISPNTETVVIKYPFSNGVREDVLEMIKDLSHFYILCCPYHEDLVIEPKGLYNYMLPVITSNFVDSKAGGNFIGGINSEEFESFKHSDVITHRSYKHLKQYGCSLYLANICDVILSDCKIMGSSSEDFIYKYILLSLVIVTGNKDKLNEIVQNSLKTSSELKDYFNNVFGEE